MIDSRRPTLSSSREEVGYNTEQRMSEAHRRYVSKKSRNSDGEALDLESYSDDGIVSLLTLVWNAGGEHTF
jgi:hypothetical protein